MKEHEADSKFWGDFLGYLEKVGQIQKNNSSYLLKQLEKHLLS